MTTIKNITALEILDSRGNPTVMVSVVLNNGITASAGVPSGASTGIREAVELRDGDAKRYGGKGVLKAVANVNKVIAPKVKGKSPHAQQEIDDLMRKLDGTDTKAKLGANAVLGVSMAVCRAAALDAGMPLYAYIRKLHGGKASAPYVLPAPMMNVLNGGAHATNNVDFQEFMLFPIGAPTFAEALRYGAETFHTLKKLLQKRGLVTAVGDEGGFAPNLKTNTEAVDVILEAIQVAGYKAGKQIAIALDPAASEFFDEGTYVMKKSDRSRKTPAEMVSLWGDWARRYPIVSLEDGMSEEDRDGWRALTKRASAISPTRQTGSSFLFLALHSRTTTKGASAPRFTSAQVSCRNSSCRPACGRSSVRPRRFWTRARRAQAAEDQWLGPGNAGAWQCSPRPGHSARIPWP
jgi:enolase